jgi:hypothetical protein
VLANCIVGIDIPTRLNRTTINSLFNLNKIKKRNLNQNLHTSNVRSRDEANTLLLALPLSKESQNKLPVRRKIIYINRAFLESKIFLGSMLLNIVTN